MKLKTLSIAIATAGSMLAGSAFALAPSAVTGNATVDMFLAGSSAQDKLVQDLYSEMCDAGTLDYFTDNNHTTGGVYDKAEGTNYNAARCTMTENNAAVNADLNGDGLINAAKVDVFVRKRSAGGSGQGVVPVANDTSITYMQVTEANCGGAPAGVDANGVKVWVCSSATTDSHIPTAGISDVEPALFAATANGGSSFNASEFTAATVVSSNAVVFGVPVTKNLRDTLQLVQGKPVGSDKVSDMPSLSRTQITSIFSGTPYDWTSFKVANPDNPAGAFISLTAVPTTSAGVAAGLAAPLQTRINICTRTAGSGTRAQFNALFMNNPCDVSNGYIIKADNTSDPITGATVAQTNTAITTPFVPAVHENSGAGDLGTCLDNLNDGSNWGIAYNSLEKYSAKWRFVAIDGVAPTLKNVADGKYFDVVANSYQWRAVTDVPTLAQVNLIKTISVNAAKPTKLQLSNVDFSTHDYILNDDGTNTASDATSVGYLSLNKSFTPTAPFSQANPVMTWTRNGSANTLSPASCRLPILNKNSVLN